ncbi:MAG TPA: glycosyltransferase family 2 protein [Anaerolineae bacterium]|nr:glycosyltransferase family 2 protein [Anaerolineae bacterium]
MDANILILIPAYNEAAHLGQVVEQALKQLPVLVVDDGSTDETASLAEQAGAIVLRQAQNQGKGAALRMGMRYALDKGYKAVITLDADGQHDPAEVEKFVHAYSVCRADLIVGIRNFYEIPPVRRVANWLGRYALSWVLGQPIPDNQSGYRLISRRLIQRLLNSEEPGFEFEVEMIVTCFQLGYQLAGVPIRTIYDNERSHIQPLSHVVNFGRMLWQTYHLVHRPSSSEVSLRDWITTRISNADETTL